VSEDRSSRATVPAQPTPTSGVPSATSTAPMLEIENISVYYGNIAAVKGVSLSVMAGEIVTLIGSNGAGKSTTLRTISGLLRPRQGTIRFNGKAIDRTPADQIVRLGIAHSPEGRRIFPRMTVAENLDLGAFLRKDKAGIAEDQERMLELFPRLRERIGQKAGTLSGGEQQMLAVARALMARPKLLLLDEPSMGLAPVLVDVIFATITQIRQQGITVLVVEQNALAALKVADRAYVLESGSMHMEGPAAEMADNPEIARAYLGG
jgi:branched-chain amino acid transport system ATP-binding protein